MEEIDDTIATIQPRKTETEKKGGGLRVKTKKENKPRRQKII